MSSLYFNQDISWGDAGTPNEYNESTYTTTTIKGRKQDGFKLIRNASGDQAVSSAMVMTETAVGVKDLLDGDEVMASNPIRDLDGNILHYEVWLI